MKKFLILLVFLLLTGCASVQNPSENKINSKSNNSLIVIKEANPCSEAADLDKCYMRIAVEKEDRSYCEKLANIKKDTCYMQLAAWYNIPEYCEQVTDLNEKDLCFFGMAIQTSNVSLCNKIRDVSEINTNKPVCLDVASVKNTKPNLRNKSLLEDSHIMNIEYITSEQVDSKLIELLKQKLGKKEIRNLVPSKIGSFENANDWFTYYYSNPSPELTPEAIRHLIRGKKFDPAQPPSAMPVFFHEVFKANSDKYETWILELKDLKGNERIIIWQTLWYVNSEKSKSLLEKEKTISPEARNYITSLMNENPKDILSQQKDEILYGYQLDNLWGTFFATGNDKSVKKIISTLFWLIEYENFYNQRIDDVKKGNAKRLTEEEKLMFIKYTVAESAKWSLTSNALQHDKVLEICTKELSEETGITKEILKDILKDVDQEKLKEK